VAGPVVSPCFTTDHTDRKSAVFQRLLAIFLQHIPYYPQFVSESLIQLYILGHYTSELENYHLKLKLNSVGFSPQANYTDRATAACRRS
jgi:hypothetical protein